MGSVHGAGLNHPYSGTDPSLDPRAFAGHRNSKGSFDFGHLVLFPQNHKKLSHGGTLAAVTSQRHRRRRRFSHRWVLFVLGYCLIADEGSVEWVEEENPMGVVKEVGNKENRVALGVVGGVKGQCLGVGSVMVCFGCKEMVDVGDGSLIEK
ncbi:hypothetical protein V6N11_075484 [Hibiscus sabdariffa]|uniref:Uncharacterized protein n=1 Tax=Hibiscus sabdariffa TaxID=183260 RepID=A0ABR2R6M2_9ROSI